MLEKTGKHRFISPRRNFLSYIVPLIRTVSLTQVRSCVSTPNQSWDWVSPRPWAHPWNEVNLPELNISKDSDWVATNLTPGRGKRESKHNRIQSEEMEIFQGPQRFYVNSSNIMALWTPASIFWFIKVKRCIWYNTLAGRYHLSNKLSIPLKKKKKLFLGIICLAVFTCYNSQSISFTHWKCISQWSSVYTLSSITIIIHQFRTLKRLLRTDYADFVGSIEA